MTFRSGTEGGTPWHTLAHFYQLYNKNVPDCARVCQTPAHTRHRELLCKSTSVPGVPTVPDLHLSLMRCSKNKRFCSFSLHLRPLYGECRHTWHARHGGQC